MFRLEVDFNIDELAIDGGSCSGKGCVLTFLSENVIDGAAVWTCSSVSVDCSVTETFASTAIGDIVIDCGFGKAISSDDCNRSDLPDNDTEWRGESRGESE